MIASNGKEGNISNVANAWITTGGYGGCVRSRIPNHATATYVDEPTDDSKWNTTTTEPISIRCPHFEAGHVTHVTDDNDDLASLLVEGWYRG